MSLLAKRCSQFSIASHAAPVDREVAIDDNFKRTPKSKER